uniref:Ig-like domain-containing protein n=1 Tax=Haplochromis burtoni TaxID=8153 RepID=A0A3Q2WRZ6_HAPBU
AKLKNITAESGLNVTLPCRAPNNDILISVVEWSRPDLKRDEYVILYRDNQLHPDYQDPSFKGRVDLQDSQMKDGDVSLVLKDVTISDAGTYECRIIQRTGTTRMKRTWLTTDPINIINLSVVPSGEFSGNVISTCYRALVSKISQVEDSKEPKFGNMFPAFSGNISCGISNKLRQIYIY